MDDNKLRVLLGPPERTPDQAFVHAVTREILIEERLRAARRSAWSRFWTEFAATVGVLAAAAVAMALASQSSSLSGMLMLVLLGSWVVIVRPPTPVFR